MAGRQVHVSRPVVRWLALLLGGVLGAWMANDLAADAGGWVPHLTSHLSAGALGAVALYGALAWQRHLVRDGRQSDRRAALVVVGGAALFTASQLVESLAAVIEYPDDGLLHAGSGMIAVLAFGILMLGLLLAAWAWLTGRRVPAWAIGLVLLLATSFLLPLIFGFG